MSPDYFGSRLTAYEAAAYVRGLARRYRAAWEQARYTSFHAAAPHCTKEFTFESLGKFSWEDDSSDNGEEFNEGWNDEAWSDEITKLRERAIARDKLMGLDNKRLFYGK